MSEYLHLELTARNLRMEIENYSREHPNDFGIPDGKERIPMKKLMKLFAVKKKTSAEKQNLFRQLVNDHCELEIKEEIGKVLVLIECDDYESSDDEYGDSDDDDDDELDYGYGEAAPSDFEVGLKSESDDERNGRPNRFRAPPHTASGDLSVATAESVGVYDANNTGVRRTGYRRRGSVTRYSVVGADAVVAEFKKHEDIINQFRRDSLKIEHSIRNLNLGNESNLSTSHKSNTEAFESSSNSSSKKLTPSDAKKGGKRSGVKKLLGRGRGRFSLSL
jgi:hypothetical protein